MELRNITKVVEGTYKVDSLPCPNCQDTLTIELDGANVFLYHRGASSEEVLEHLSLDDRERFISGYCGPCWDEVWGEDEEEEEEW